MSNTVMIPRASLHAATDGTISSENQCSHVTAGTCPTPAKCDDYGCVGICARRVPHSSSACSADRTMQRREMDNALRGCVEVSK